MKSPEEAFKDCSAIVILNDIVQEEEESYDSWIKRNYDFFVNYAQIINKVAKKTARVLIAGNGPLNFNAMFMIKNAPNVSWKLYCQTTSGAEA